MHAMTLFHTLCGVAALIAGGAVIGMRKGTRAHRRVGWVYAAAMALLCGTSFFIYELFGGFGAFHLAALVSSVSVLGGMLAPLFRGWIGDDWLEAHYKFMLWSYVGLVMATGSHFFEPLGAFFQRATPWSAGACLLATALVCWGLPAAVGGCLVNSRQEATERRARALLEQRRDAVVSDP